MDESTDVETLETRECAHTALMPSFVTVNSEDNKRQEMSVKIRTITSSSFPVNQIPGS